MRTARLAVAGSGGHAKVVVAAARACGLQVTCLLDDDVGRWESSVLGIAVRGPIAAGLEALGPDTLGFLAIGANGVRRSLDRCFPSAGWAVIAHPHAWIDETATLEEGGLVCPGAVVHPDARVGRHAIINTSAVVEHDVEVGAYAHVAPRCTLTGGVRVDEGAFLGAGSVVLPGRRVGAWAVVGAGAVVTRDVPDWTVSVGVPNRTVRELHRVEV